MYRTTHDWCVQERTPSVCEIMMAKILQHTLANGLSVVIEPNAGVQSAGLCLLVPAGVARDPDNRQGLSSLWAELLLRGAGTHDSRAQADAFDMLGANRSTHVSSRFVSVSATVMGDRVLEVLPLIAEMIRQPRFDTDALEPSRELCMASIESLKDDPGAMAGLAAKTRHLPVPFNRSSYGTIEGLEAITRDDIVSGWVQRAVPNGSILSIAGQVDADAIIKHLEALLGDWDGSVDEPEPQKTPERGYDHIDDDTNQVQIILMADAPHASSQHAMFERLVTAVLSGGMSARLFTEVREKRGLCYSVHARYASDRDFGLLSAKVGTQPERAQESLDVLVDELLRINTAEGRVTKEEFDRAVIGMKSRLIFSGESTGARASALASDLFKLGRPRSLDDVAGEIDAITLDALNAYVATRELGRVTVQTLGPNPLHMPGALER